MQLKSKGTFADIVDIFEQAFSKNYYWQRDANIVCLFVCLFVCLLFPVDQVSKQINYTNSINTGGDAAASVINGTGGISIVRNGGSGITITCFYNSSGKSINGFKEFFVVLDTGLYMSALFRRIILSEIKLRKKCAKWAEFSKNQAQNPHNNNTLNRT